MKNTNKELKTKNKNEKIKMKSKKWKMENGECKINLNKKQRKWKTTWKIKHLKRRTKT